MKKKPARKKPATKPVRNSDEDRGIFRFLVVGKLFRVDPLEVLMKLQDNPNFDLNRDPTLASSEDAIEADRVAAMRRTMAAVADAFGVKGIAEGGLTVTERMELLLRFCQWCDGQKKSSDPSPTSSRISDSHQDESPESRHSGSISTKNESSCDEACQPASAAGSR